MVYLRDLAQGLVRDSPQTQEGSAMGAQRLQRQAEDLEKEYDDVSDKVRSGMKNMAKKTKVQHLSLHLNSNHCLNQICRIICKFFWVSLAGRVFSLCISFSLFIMFYVIDKIPIKMYHRNTFEPINK